MTVHCSVTLIFLFAKVFLDLTMICVYVIFTLICLVLVVNVNKLEKVRKIRIECDGIFADVIPLRDGISSNP